MGCLRRLRDPNPPMVMASSRLKCHQKKCAGFAVEGVRNVSRVAALHQQGLGRAAMAQQLNAEGWRPAKRRQTFTADMVGALLARQGLGVSPSRPRAVARKPDEWTLPELAYTLAMPEPTLYSWLRKGHLKARRDQGSGQWLLWADASELQRLRRLRQAPRVWKRPSPRKSSME
jgi:hypothetical protein